MSITIKPTDDLDHKMVGWSRSWFQTSHLNGLTTWRPRSRKLLTGNRKETESPKWAKRWLTKVFKRSKSFSIRKSSQKFISWDRCRYPSKWCNSVWQQVLPVWASIRHQRLPETAATVKATPTAERWWTSTTLTVTPRSSKWVYLHRTKLQAKEITLSQTSRNAVNQQERLKINSRLRSNSKALETKTLRFNPIRILILILINWNKFAECALIKNYNKKNKN